MLELPYAKCEDDVPDAADHGERRHPRDKEDRAAAVVAGGPEPEHDLDDSRNKWQPPPPDLAAHRDGHDDVERPGEDEEEAEDRGERAERVAGMDEGHDSG